MKIKPKKTKQKIHTGRLILSALGLTAALILVNDYTLRKSVTMLSNANSGGFHLSEEVYGSNSGNGLNFNVHVKFNSDGCDGDIGLYDSGGNFIAGINSWNVGKMGSFDYDETHTGSPYFIPNDGAPHDLSFKGEVRRCPQSTVVLWDSITCTVTYDASGMPQISPPDLCTIKNMQDIQPVPQTASQGPNPTGPPTPTDVPPVNPVDTQPPAQPQPTDIPAPTLPPGAPTLTSAPNSPAPTAVNLPTPVPPTPTQSPLGGIPFMGVKLGSLTPAQPLNIFFDILQLIGGIFK